MLISLDWLKQYVDIKEDIRIRKCFNNDRTRGRSYRYSRKTS